LRCSNYRDGHDKGHQFHTRSSSSHSDGWILEGEFEPTLDPDPVLDTLQSKITQYIDCEDKGELGWLAKESGVDEVTSNTTCFTCLSHSPRYILPCDNKLQHLICEECAIRFSSDFSQGTLIIDRCPLGCDLADGKPWKIRLKPPTAGARLLALDGYATAPRDHHPY